MLFFSHYFRVQLIIVHIFCFIQQSYGIKIISLQENQ